MPKQPSFEIHEPKPPAATAVQRALRQALCQKTEGAARQGHRFIVAVSGGPDSQALLDGVGRLAAELRLQPLAVGIDHGLRPAAAQELILAQALARAHGIPYQSVSVVLPQTGNVLAQARRARYCALRERAAHWGAGAILVGHTANDQAETVLFHLARGAGLRGAAGMAPHRGLICRPLLEVSRSDVMAHLEAFSIAHAFDPSNAQRARSRIAMRTQVLPALSAINSATIAHLGAFARIARADNLLLERLARRLLSRCLIDGRGLSVAALGRGPQALWPRVLRLWLRGYGCRPDARALARLMRVLGCPHEPLAQGAMPGCTVHLRQGRLYAVTGATLPPRRAGT